MISHLVLDWSSEHNFDIFIVPSIPHCLISHLVSDCSSEDGLGGLDVVFIHV